MRSSSQNTTNDDHHGSQDNRSLSSQVVARNSNHDLSQHFAHEQGVADARTDVGGVLLGVLGAEQDIAHRHEVVLVTIGNEGKASTEDGKEGGHGLPARARGSYLDVSVCVCLGGDHVDRVDAFVDGFFGVCHVAEQLLSSC